jgi:acyl carrier protein
LVRRLADGDLEFIGRLDQQVKIRGFRIELGEIEQVLVGHNLVHSARVCARASNSGAGDKYLVAYVVASALPSAQAEPAASHALVEQLRTYLLQYLPAYMQPAHFVLLDALPLTPNGKLDTRALPAPDTAALLADYVAPSTPVEQVLCALWQEVLVLERVGVTDNFFQLGGHSLTATRLVTRINQHFQVTVPLVALFQCEHLAALAEVLSEHLIHHKSQQLELHMATALEVEW